MQDTFEKANEFKIKARPSSHRKGVTVIRFSSSGGLMGIADDGGYLILRETQDWAGVRKLKAPAPIRAFEFHPVDQHALVVGCTNGEIFKIVLDPKGPSGDFYGIESVDGFIHAMAIDDDGNQVAVAYADRSGMHVKVFTLDNFRGSWGNGRFLPTPILDRSTFSGYPFIRNMVFLSRKKMLVSFFPDTLGLRVFNIERAPFQTDNRIKLRPGTLIGSSAVSPSRRIVAVVNMLDGIDIYDIAGARLIKTIAYDLAELYMMDIRFLDEERLVSGYSRGTLVITSCSRATSIDPIMIEGVNMDPLQAIAVATVNGVLWIAAGSTPVVDDKSRVILFCRDREDSSPGTAKGTIMQALNKVPAVVRYSLAAMVLSLCLANLSSSTASKGSNADIVPATVLRAQAPIITPISTARVSFVQPITETRTVTMTMSPITRIATIPGPMTTTTKFIVEKITETRVISTTVSVGIPTPACTTRTLFEMSTHTATTTVEREAPTCTASVCSHEMCNTQQCQTLDFLLQFCAIAAACLGIWSFYSDAPDPSLAVLELVAETSDDEGGGTLGVGSDKMSSDVGDASRDGDLTDNTESSIGTTETESTRGGEESDRENTLDEAEDRGAMFDTDLDVEEFAKGVRADEQDMGGNSLGDDGEAMGGNKNKLREEPKIEGDAVGSSQSPEVPAVQTHVAEGEVIGGSSEHPMKGEEVGSAPQEEGPVVNASPVEDVVADREGGIERAAEEAMADALDGADPAADPAAGGAEVDVSLGVPLEEDSSQSQQKKAGKRVKARK